MPVPGLPLHHVAPGEAELPQHGIAFIHRFFKLAVLTLFRLGSITKTVTAIAIM